MTEAALREAFRYQGVACAELGSPFMGRLCALLAERPWPDGPVMSRLAAWTGELGPSGASLPLRLAGGLHALALQDRAGLREVYPPQEVSDDGLWAGVAQALTREAEFLDRWIDSPPQTNEVRRSTVLIAAGHWLADRFGLPLRLSELGASAGLNLMWDRFALQIGEAQFGAADPVLTLAPEWTGPRPPAPRPEVAERGGADLNPLDPQADALRLMAYLWPDQPERLERTRAAISVAAAKVDKADAIDWLAPRLAPVPGRTHLIYHTVAWQYFPAEVQARGTALIEAAGRQATEDAPLAWFGMETDGIGPGARLTLRLWPGDLHLAMGRADFHGRWVNWTPPER